MPFLNDIDQNINKNEIALKKLMLEIERLEQETSKIFEELAISPEQFQKYASNPANFSEEDWNALQDQKNKLDQKLDLSVAQVAHPSKTAKARSDMQLSQNWLFVR